MMNKGILQSLEAVIAVLMILTTFVVLFAPREGLPEFETVSWKLRGFNSLKALDDNNELRMYALTNNTQTINEKLQSLLLSNMNFDVRICNQTCVNPNITAERIVSVSYLIAGNTSNFGPREIVLYMW